MVNRGRSEFHARVNRGRTEFLQKIVALCAPQLRSRVDLEPTRVKKPGRKPDFSVQNSESLPTLRLVIRDPDVKQH